VIFLLGNGKVCDPQEALQAYMEILGVIQSAYPLVKSIP
jgi:hypothetical protein